MSIKYHLKKYISYKKRKRLNRLFRKTKNLFFNFDKKKVEIDQLSTLLESEFNIHSGDSIIVSSSFGNLNAAFSPKELILLLQRLVGEEGNIVMPFYPPGNSHEWADSSQVFNMKTTRSSMGILTQVFSKMANVYKSIHPTKAVVAWGKNANEIVAGHENSTTPFYWDSPYGWLLKNPSKSLGLGLKNIPIFHAFEDIILENQLSLYQDSRKKLRVSDYTGNVETMEVLVHDPAKIAKLIDAGDYVKNLNISSYLRQDIGYAFCYIADNKELFKRCEKEFNEGNFRTKK